MNLTYAECRYHGRTLFGRLPRKQHIECMICGSPVSADGADIQVKEVHHRRKHNSLHGAELGRGALSVPLPEQGLLIIEEE